MAVNITVRHKEVGRGMHEYAQQKADEIIASFPRVEHVHVIIDSEKHLAVAEVVVQAKNHIRVEASESTSQVRASIDKAFDKVEKQLRKLRDKILDHRPKGKAGKDVLADDLSDN